MTVDSGHVASVLVVDDTVDNLRLLASMLSAHGYEVRPVTNGRQALQAVERDPPDLILLDITMPDMDGYEVCRRLKADARSRDVPVIFLTALTDTVDKVKAFETGGVDYVTKPFQFDEVLARVKTHVALRRAQAALAESLTRLQKLEKLRDDLVHMVVHDMRSPLTALMVSLSMVRDDKSDALSDECTAILRSAVDTTEELSRMANDLLDVSRIEEGKMPVVRSACDVAGLASEVRASLLRMEPTRRIDVEDDGQCKVFCDPGIVRRVLENLVTNAVKHTPSGTPVRLAIARQDGRVRVAVHDAGTGVPPEAREHIFEKFGTVQTRHAHRYHSAGLGLAFCKLAVEAHGGTIGVDPGVPVGSTFWFELPA